MDREHAAGIDQFVAVTLAGWFDEREQLQAERDQLQARIRDIDDRVFDVLRAWAQ